MDLFETLRTGIFSKTTMWGILAVATVVTVSLSAVLYYHWNTYSTGDKRAKRMKRIFTVGAIILLLSVGSFIFSV